MNDIKTVDSSQALAGNRSAAADHAVQAAKAATADGKVLPDAAGQAQQAAKQQQQAAAESSANFSADREKRVERAVAQLNDYVQSFQRDLRFTVDEDLGRAIVHVVDKNTQEVIRQIPNETALRLARNLKDIRQLQQENQLQQVSNNNTGPAAGSNLEASLGLINTRI